MLQGSIDVKPSPQPVDILLYWTDGEASEAKETNWKLFKASSVFVDAAMQSVDSKYKPHCTSAHSTLKTFLHICAKLSLGWICVVIRTLSSVCWLALELQTSASVHIWACKLHIHRAQQAHHAYMCSLCTRVHKYSLRTMHGLHVLAATSDLDCTV